MCIKSFWLYDKTITMQSKNYWHIYYKMNSNKKELLKVLLSEGFYISAKLENQDEIMQAIDEIWAKIVYIMLQDKNEAAFISLDVKAFSDTGWEMIILRKDFCNLWVNN